MTGCRRTRGGALVAPLLLAILASGPGGARAAPGAVCLVPSAAADGLEPRTVRAALLVEARKAGRDTSVVTARTAARCPGAVGPVVRVALGPGARATVDDGRDDGQGFDLSETLPVDRARTIARAALSVLAAQAADGPPEVLIDLSSPVAPPPPPPPPVPLAPAVALLAGGGYVHGVGTGSHHGGVDAEVALWLYEGRLSLGVAGGYRPGAPVGSGEPAAHLAAGELLAMVRGGIAVGPLLLRLGVGGGYEWRRLRVHSAHRLEDGHAASGAALIAVEPELAWRVAAPFSVHLVVPGRAYLGGVSHHWKGRTLGDAPRGAVGVSVRAGVAF